MKTSVISTALALISWPMLHAADDPFAPIGPKDKPRKIAIKVAQIQVEFIEVSHQDLTQLLKVDGKGVADSSEMRMTVQKLAEGGQAKVIDTQVLRCRNGEIARAQSTHPSIKNLIPNANKGAVEGADPAPDANAQIAAAIEAVQTLSILEVEPTIGIDEDTINLRFSSELVTHDGNPIWRETKDKNGKVQKAKLPNLNKFSINKALTFKSGQPQLVAVLSPKDDQGKINTERKVMVFINCDVLFL